jgi:hypothetical protein
MGAMDLNGRDWIARLPAELAPQRAILDGLLSLCEAIAGIRWLVIGCSVARGTADRYSDLDVAVGARDEEFPAIAAAVRQGADRLGPLVESFQHRLPSVPATHERIFAQFADGGQVDLVVYPASVPAGAIPDVVVLYDPDHQLVTGGGRAPAVTPAQVREWAFQGWCALADLGKYLRRQSPWEALSRLNEARDQLWRLWAAAQDVPSPQYGLTSILDFGAGQIPAAMEATVCDLDAARLLSAGQSLAALLSEAGRYLGADQRAALPDAMARYVIADLATVQLATVQLGAAQLMTTPPPAAAGGLCPHRQAYLDAMGLWGSPPGSAGPSATGPGVTDGGGRFAPGLDGADREAAFRGWHLVTSGDEHVDPCE